MAGVTRIAMVAGEASGDLLGAHLIQALRRLLPDAEFVGIGGPRMQTCGFRSLYDMESLSVHGYVDALKNLREISGIRRSLARDLKKLMPAVFIGIDAPDFNLNLEARLRRRKIPAIHYVGPSIWAWRGGRIDRIKASVDRILVLFPFEEPIYRAKGIPVTYVGHPLAEEIALENPKSRARERLVMTEGHPVFALLPGSRRSEVELLGGVFLQTARLLKERFPNAHFLIPTATRESRLKLEQTMEEMDMDQSAITLLFGHAQDAMAAADVVLVASGTATLEAALIKRPMVIAYKVSQVQYPLLKRMAYLPYFGLPNILAGEFIVPEFIQDNATPENLAQALGNVALDDYVRARLELRFTRMHQRLRCNTAQRAASVVLEVMSGQTAACQTTEATA